MSVEFRTYLLSEIASKITKGTTPSKKDGGFSESGINYIKAESVGFDGRIDRSKFAFISEDVHHKLKRSQLEVNDILFSMAGVHLGKVALVEEQHVPANTNQALALIRPITSLVNPLYLLYFLQQREVVHFVNNAISQSAQPNINLKQIGDLEIRLPELAVQNKVVDILSSLDRKLEINTDINQNLENIAQAIFKSWFVDFDPVKAKMNGEQPEGMDASTASLFPEKLVESELGLIPEGWDAGTVGSVTAAKGGYAFKSKQFVDEGNPVIKIKNITSAGTVTTSDCQCVDDDIAKTASRFKLSDGDLLMAMTGATVGKSGIYVSDGRDGYLNQRVARFESKVDSTQPCWFTYNLVNKDSIFEQIVGAAQGSAQPNISSKGIEQVKTVIPTFDLISKYQELVAPLYAKWISNFRENSQLSELRDTLLPKLLSGEIELGETEEMAEVN
ncbi:restriction endonuclease subunit S [Vibrio diabolicus]|uniref:restriction endonuclease subunit S n=1 Tax=Vibrio diabolicus TaxID=50719 RepID=UPI0037519AC4